MRFGSLTTLRILCGSHQGEIYSVSWIGRTLIIDHLKVSHKVVVSTLNSLLPLPSSPSIKVSVWAESCSPFQLGSFSPESNPNGKM